MQLQTLFLVKLDLSKYRVTIKIAVYMANSTIVPQHGREQNQEMWLSLRQLIAKSSGFQRWQQERDISINNDLDRQVRRYLEETLETLAY